MGSIGTILSTPSVPRWFGWWTPAKELRLDLITPTTSPEVLFERHHAPDGTPHSAQARLLKDLGVDNTNMGDGRDEVPSGERIDESPWAMSRMQQRTFSKDMLTVP